MANHDMLSGLPNRRYFEERVRHALQAKDSPTITAVMLLDMDRFKYANDTYGHSAGDQIIRQAAQRLTEVIDGCGTVARQSGDEFAILLECETQPGQLSLWADRIQGAMARPFELHEHIEYLLTVSIGIAFAQAGATELELMRKADLALYRAKSQGGGRQVFYQEEMSHSLTRQLAMEQALRKAIEQNELLLHYQPQFAAESQALIGAEALIRWQPKNGPSVSPAVFIPIAEETGLIVPIGNWVTRTACRQAVAWMQQGLSQPFLISVNVSLRQFQEPDFVASIIAILEETTLPPELLVLEITESIAMSDEREAVEKLLALKDRGIQIAMDDFGTGYSSLAVLKRYQVDKLKIDQAFVRDIGENEEQSTIIEAILAMAASLKVEVIAEGVETHSQYLFLKERGCGAIQGYYFGKPLAVADFEGRFLR
nr:EAL domain-containing protein [Paenibacillus phyllosphaerae]